MTDQYTQLDELYSQLPQLECRGKCQDACGPIDMSTAERQRIRARGTDIPRLSLTCPALTFLGTCSVYDIRPLICRLWGLVEAMACPHGCRPEGGFLDDTTALEFLARSLEIGGRPHSLPKLPAAKVRQAMSAPHLAAAVGQLLRSHHRSGQEP